MIFSRLKGIISLAIMLHFHMTKLWRWRWIGVYVVLWEILQAYETRICECGMNMKQWLCIIHVDQLDGTAF